MSTETTTPLPASPPLSSSDWLGDRRALQFTIGDRIYWLGRSRDGNAWTIMANGDLVEHASILHYGDVAAFLKTASRMREIENQWAARAVA